MAGILRLVRQSMGRGGLLLAMLLGFANPAHAEQRLALIIANEAYVSPSLGRLPGTQSDAQRMNAALTKAGFTVRTVSNTQKATMQRAVADFVRDLARAGQDGVGFLYYTGHGIADAKRGANYLIPVEAEISGTAELPLYALPMDDVLDAIEGAGARAAFVVFDACRSTPTSLSRGGKGLLPSRGRTDTLVAFATAPGEIAADDGLYSRVLADHLARAGANSTTLFADVQSEVARTSGRRQVPQFLSSLVDAVQFVTPTVANPAASTRPPAAPVDLYARWGVTARDFSLTDGKTLLERAGASSRFADILRGAQDGAPVAQTLAGLAYHEGSGTGRDYAEAMRWYREAAELEQPRAMRGIGYLYEAGQGVTQDYAEAMRWYRKAAGLGDAGAMKYIGYLYDTGHGVTQDYAEAMRWYRKAADLGNAEAMYNIGYLYGAGQGVTQDYAEAMRWYRKAADLGNADAMNNIGYLFGAGQGVTQDYAAAMRWYRKAVDLGSADAMCNIGYLYGAGQGVTQDYAEAMRWYRKAADLGNPGAMSNIGYMYEAADGVKQDYAEAMRWYRKAADLGNAAAIKNIGYLYSNGHGVTQDYAEAMRWYRKAADLGNANAMNNIGYLYHIGHGVTQDYAEAKRWYRKAAGLGDSHANENLRKLEATGR